MRVLVGIINHGTKNDVHLAKVLDVLRPMPWDVDIVVFSDREKDLGEDVELRVGVPKLGPLYLPLMNRRLFADRRGEYDVYIAAEDDTLITERHVQAFVEASRVCDERTVPGFLRYEHWPPDNRMYVDSLHRYFCWDPFSTFRRGEWMFAEVTNVQAAVYMLTRTHLEQALASGQFDAVYQPSRLHGLLEAASSQVFESCGLRKVVPINRIDDFLMHHMPNRFHEWRMGLPRSRFDAQLEALAEIIQGRRKPQRLLDVHTRLNRWWWDKCYDEPSRDDLLHAAGDSPADILWLGASGSDAEEALIARGHRLTGIPLDSVVAKVAESQGSEVTPADFDEALAALEGRTFDVIFAVNMLERLTDPVDMLNRLRPLLGARGRLIFVVPNFDRWWSWPHDERRLTDATDLPLPWTYEQTGLHFTTTALVNEWLTAAALNSTLHYPRPDRYRRFDLPTLGRLRRKMAYEIFGVASPSAPD